MAEADYFLIALVAGLVLLGGLYASTVFHIGSAPSGNVKDVEPITHSKEIQLPDNPSYGLVGNSPDISTLTKDFGVFTASYEDGYEFMGNESSPVYNGLLYGKHYLAFSAEPGNPVEAWVSFNVSSTNRYGLLVVRAGNCTLYEGRPEKGHYDIPVPSNCLTNRTEVLIATTSSGWRLWAPSFYNISSASLKLRKYVSNPARLKFSLDGETYNGFQQGVLMIYFGYVDSNVTVRVNNREVYRGHADYETTVKFGKMDARKGTNIIEILPSQGGLIRGRAELEIMFSSNMPHRIEQDFYIGQPEWLSLGNGCGVASFYVGRVHSPGGIAVRIENGAGNHTKYYQLKEGLYQVPLCKSELSRGLNRIVVEGIDGALFETSEIEVRV